MNAATIPTKALNGIPIIEVKSERQAYLERVGARAIAAGLAFTAKEADILIAIYGPAKVDGIAKMINSGFKVSASNETLFPSPSLAAVKPPQKEEPKKTPLVAVKTETVKKPKAPKAETPQVRLGSELTFRQLTIAEAIEALDISKKQADEFIGHGSVTALAAVIEISKACNPKIAGVIARSKRPFDHIENIFSDAQVSNLHGKERILKLIKDYCELAAIV